MKAEQVYRRRLIVVAVAYTVLIVLSLSVVKSLGDSPLRLIVAMLPLVPVLFGIGAFLAYLRQLDELQRRIQFEAFGFSLGLTGLVTFTLGLLENVGFPRISLVWVFPMLILSWGIGHFIAGRRY